MREDNTIRNTINVRLLATVLLVLSGALVIGIYLYFSGEDFHADYSRRTDEGLTLVLSGSSRDRWGQLERGVGQACDELGIMNPDIVLTGEDGIGDSITFLIRGATPDFQLPKVDDEQLGHDLYVETAAALDKNDRGSQSQRVLLLIPVSEPEYSYLRAKGFEDAAAADASGQMEIIRSFAYTEDQIRKTLTRDGYDVIVSLSAGVTDRVNSVLIETKLTKMPVFTGVGTGNQAVYAVDIGVMNTLCYVDELNMGYIAMIRLSEKIGYGRKTFPDVIEYHMINKQNLFSSEHIRLLFPIN